MLTAWTSKTKFNEKHEPIFNTNAAKNIFQRDSVISASLRRRILQRSVNPKYLLNSTLEP